VLLDTNVWRQIVDADAAERLRAEVKRSGSEILIAPGVVYEMLRTSDRELRHRQLKVATLRVWTRLMPEVFTETDDIRRVIERHRPEWLRETPDLRSFHRFRADWAGGRGFWARAREDPDSEASLTRTLGEEALERAREDMKENRRLMSHLHYDKVPLAGWTGRPPTGEPGWGGAEIDVWRISSATAWWVNLVVRRHETYLDWLGPFVDLGRISAARASWNQLWASEVTVEDVPREWLRWAVRWLQGLRRVSPGSPGDNQISIYAYEADLFATTDKTFADILDKVGREAPQPMAVAVRVPSGAEAVDIVIQLLHGST
jgi:hypothetical protein